MKNSSFMMTKFRSILWSIWWRPGRENGVMEIVLGLDTSSSWNYYDYCGLDLDCLNELRLGWYYILLLTHCLEAFKLELAKLVSSQCCQALAQHYEEASLYQACSGLLNYQLVSRELTTSWIRPELEIKLTESQNQHFKHQRFNADVGTDGVHLGRVLRDDDGDEY